MARRLGALGVLMVVLFGSFLATTALLDWVCRHNGFYEEAAKEAVVMD